MQLSLSFFGGFLEQQKILTLTLIHGPSQNRMFFKLYG